MCCHIGGGVPFDPSDVWRCGDWWMLFWKVAFLVREIGIRGTWWVGDDIMMVKKDPEDFFRQIVELFMPSPIRSWVID